MQNVSVAADLRLKPQARAVLRYLKNNVKISPAKADRVFGITRLAACIYEIRQIGYNVISKIKRDEVGHKYTEYALVKYN